MYTTLSMVAAAGQIWGSGLGWCMSDLDETPGGDAVYGVEECWTKCVAYFSDYTIQAVDYNENESDGQRCWCQTSCDCMEDVGDDGVTLMTSATDPLPDTCQDSDSGMARFRPPLDYEIVYCNNNK